MLSEVIKKNALSMSFSGIEHKVVHGYLFKIYTLSCHFAIDAFFPSCSCLVCSSEISRFQQLLSAEGQSRLSVMRLQPPVFEHLLQSCHRHICFECQIAGNPVVVPDAFDNLKKIHRNNHQQ
jgi:hypothetical protein